VQLDAVKHFADRSSRELIFVVGTASREKLRDTGAAFAETLRGSHAFARVDYEVDDRYIAAARADRDLRSALLGSRDRERLVRGDVAALERDALRAAYTPLGFTRAFSISDDPLGLASGAFARNCRARAARASRATSWSCANGVMSKAPRSRRVPGPSCVRRPPATHTAPTPTTT